MKTPYNQNNIGKNLAKERKIMGMTIEQLAKKSGLSAREISNLGRGVNKNPKIKTLIQLSGALGVTLGDILMK